MSMIPSRYKNWHSLLFFISLSSIIILQIIWMNRDHYPPFWDQASYYLNSLEAGNFLSNEGAKGFFKAIHVNSYRPTAVFIVTGFLERIFGHIKGIGLLVNLICMTILVLSVRQMGKILGSEMMGNLSGAMTAWMPALVGFIREFLMDTAFGCAITVALLFCFKTKGFSDRRACLIGGSLLGLTFLIKSETPFYLGIPIALYIFWVQKSDFFDFDRLSRLWISAKLAFSVLALCCLPFLPVVIYKAGFISIGESFYGKFLQKIYDNQFWIKSTISLNLFMAFLFTLLFSLSFFQRRKCKIAAICLITVAGTLIMTDFVREIILSKRYLFMAAFLCFVFYLFMCNLVRILVFRMGNIALYIWTTMVVAGIWTIPNISFIHRRYLTAGARAATFYDLSDPWYALHNILRYPLEIPSDGTLPFLFLLALVGILIVIFRKNRRNILWCVATAWVLVPLIPLTYAKSVGAVIQATLPFLGGYALFAALTIEEISFMTPRVAAAVFAASFLFQVYVVTCASFAPSFFPATHLRLYSYTGGAKRRDLTLLKKNYRFLRKPSPHGPKDWGINGLLDSINMNFPKGHGLLLANDKIINSTTIWLEANIRGLTSYGLNHIFGAPEEEIFKKLFDYDFWVIKTGNEGPLKKFNTPIVNVGMEILRAGSFYRKRIRIVFEHQLPDGNRLYLVDPGHYLVDPGYRWKMAEQMPHAKIEAPPGGSIKPMGFMFGGKLYDAVFAHPPGGKDKQTSIMFDQLTIKPGDVLSGMAAFSPHTWKLGKGDGVRFAILLDLDKEGKKHVIWRGWLNPSEGKGLPYVQSFRIPLENWVLPEEPFSLSFITDPGPNGNNYYDHGWWADVKIRNVHDAE